MFGFLTGPNDQTLGQQASVQHTDGVSTIDIYEANPLPGQWLFTIGTLNPVGGTTTAARFTGSVSLSAPPVHATGVPDSAGTVIPFGGSVAAEVTVTNTGNTDLNVFIDPRRTERTFYSLLGLTQTTGLPLPLPGADAPLWIVPTQSHMLIAAAQATAPVTFDWGFGQGDPDLEARSFGDTTTGSLSAPELTNGVYFMAPALLGPFTGPASGTVNTGMAAHARVFDLSVSSSTGDPQLADVLASPPAAAPIVVHPGGSATIPVTITATDRRGSVVTGDLFLDDNQAPLGAVNEITAIPYEYKVG